MKIINGDIFKGEWDALGHCCNLFHTWGAGIVIPIKKLYPEAYKSDCETESGDLSKLGSFTYADCGAKRIYNLYGQVGIGNDGKALNRNCQYDFIFDALYKACEDIVYNPIVEDGKTIFALPAIGCGLAGGRLSIIEAIIQEVEKDFAEHIEFHLYKL
jgi:O-acetyl-ADP-ribose deacetylase (regulator of RNase III)